MYGNNNSRLGSKEHWPNGGLKPDLPFQRHMLAMQFVTNKLHTQTQRLEKEIEELRLRKRELDDKLADAAEAAKMFGLWGGHEIVDSTETKVVVTFLAYSKGKVCGKYSIGFHKFGPFWAVSHYNLPFSMKLIPTRVQKEEIQTLDKLSTMICTLQHEVNLFVWREEQFKEAKALSSSILRVYPSKSTTTVLLEVCVDDSNGSDLSEACIYLSYQINKFLPEEPLIKFKGGDKKAHDDLRRQLLTLEHMPLKDAILRAFAVEGSESDVSFLKGPNFSEVPSAERTPMPSPTFSAPNKQKSPVHDENPLPVNRSGVRRGSGRGKRGRRGPSRGRK